MKIVVWVRHFPEIRLKKRTGSAHWSAVIDNRASVYARCATVATTRRNLVARRFQGSLVMELFLKVRKSLPRFLGVHRRHLGRRFTND